MTKEQLDKLPKWAQREIDVLTMTVDELTATLQAERTITPDNKFGEVRSYTDGVIHSLANYQRVRFLVEGGYVDVSQDHHMKAVYVIGQGIVSITPRAANTFIIKCI